MQYSAGKRYKYLIVTTVQMQSRHVFPPHGPGDVEATRLSQKESVACVLVTIRQTPFSSQRACFFCIRSLCSAPLWCGSLHNSSLLACPGRVPLWPQCGWRFLFGVTRAEIAELCVPMAGDAGAEFMDMAVSQARAALASDEVPVGCVAVLEGRVVSSGHNRTNCERDPLAHAEIVALRKIVPMQGLTFYITCEPCVMCSGILARISAKVFYGCRNSIFGGISVFGWHFQDPQPVEMHCEEAAVLLQRFFLNENARAPPEKRKSKRGRRLRGE